MFRKRFIVIGLLSLVAMRRSGAQTESRPSAALDVRSERSGTWSAAASNGLTLMGTWTAVPDSTNNAVLGTWTLFDAERRTVAIGGWSAAKSRSRWTGAWRAVVSGKKGEYSGTWSSGVDLDGSAGFAELFEKAVQNVVSGSWHRGSQSGGWSIRAAERKAIP